MGKVLYPKLLSDLFTENVAAFGCKQTAFSQQKLNTRQYSSSHLIRKQSTQELILIQAHNPEA